MLAAAPSPCPRRPTRGRHENPGALDHIAFSVTDYDTLTAWSDHLDTIGIAHEAVKVNPAGGHTMDLFDPDGNNIEAVCLAAAS